MNKKGFTLIELLAVIVILAVIALIAAPAVLNVIEDSKESAAKDSAVIISKAAETYYISESVLQGEEVEPIDLTTDTLQYKGEKPDKGAIKFDDKGNAHLKMYMNGYCITHNTNNVVSSVKSSEEECEISLSYKKYNDGDAVYFNPETGTKCSEEEAVSTTETKTGCMKWYAFLDSESSKTVKLILNHNTTWLAFGGSTKEENEKKLNQLVASDVSKWDADVKKSARLISVSEIRQIAPPSVEGDTHYNFHTGTSTLYYGAAGTNKYAWLFDNLEDCEMCGCNEEPDDSDYQTLGYWTADAVDNLDSNGYCTLSFHVTTYGELTEQCVAGAHFPGIRPVIEVSKLIFE